MDLVQPEPGLGADNLETLKPVVQCVSDVGVHLTILTKAIRGERHMCRLVTVTEQSEETI